MQMTSQRFKILHGSYEWEMWRDVERKSTKVESLEWSDLNFFLSCGKICMNIHWWWMTQPSNIIAFCKSNPPVLEDIINLIKLGKFHIHKLHIFNLHRDDLSSFSLPTSQTQELGQWPCRVLQLQLQNKVSIVLHPSTESLWDFSIGFRIIAGNKLCGKKKPVVTHFARQSSQMNTTFTIFEV